jgi:hypothetical protein
MAMEPEKDGCFWAAVMVTVAAMFAWALATTLHLGEEWVSWAAIIVSVLALGGMATRFALKNRGVVWTEGMKEAQRRRSLRLVFDILWWSPITLGLWASTSLERAGIIPQWAGIVLLLLSFATALGLRFLIRSSRMWRDLN